MRCPGAGRAERDDLCGRVFPPLLSRRYAQVRTFIIDPVDKMETGARRVQKFADLVSSILLWQTDFDRRLALLLSALESTQASWSTASPATEYRAAITAMSDFAEYKKTSKRQWGREKQELGALYSNIQTKLRTYGLRSWEPREGRGLVDLEQEWAAFLAAEAKRSRGINARIRE